MFTVVFSQDLKRPHARARAMLADAVKAIHLAVEMLQNVIDNYDEPAIEYSLPKFDFMETHAAMRLHALILQEIAGGAGTLAPVVFRTIRRHKNHGAENPPSSEAALLALMLAIKAIDKAIGLSWELDGHEGDAFMLMLAASAAIRTGRDVIDGSTAEFCHDEALAFALAGKQIPSAKKLTRHFWQKRYPSGRYPDGKPVWDEAGEPIRYAAAASR